MQTPNNVFVKNLSSFTPEEVRFLFDRYQIIFAVFAKEERMHVPRALSYTETSITFTFETLSPTIADLLFEGKRCSKNVWRLVGEALGCIHRSDRNSVNDNGIVCGDFATKNMCLRTDGLMIFDVEPPPNMSGASFEKFTHNTIYLDVSRFIFSILNSHSYTKPLRFWKNHSVMIKTFLDSYQTATEFSIGPVLLRKSLEQDFSEWNAELKHSLLKRSVKSLTVRISLWLHYYVYRCL